MAECWGIGTNGRTIDFKGHVLSTSRAEIETYQLLLCVEKPLPSVSCPKDLTNGNVLNVPWEISLAKFNYVEFRISGMGVTTVRVLGPVNVR